MRRSLTTGVTIVRALKASSSSSSGLEGNEVTTSTTEAELLCLMEQKNFVFPCPCPYQRTSADPMTTYG